MKKQLLTAAAILGLLLPAFASASAYQSTKPKLCGFKDYFVPNVGRLLSINENSGNIQAIQDNSYYPFVFYIEEGPSSICNIGNGEVSVTIGTDNNNNCTLTIEDGAWLEIASVTNYSCKGNFTTTGTMTYPYLQPHGYELIFSVNPNK